MYDYLKEKPWLLSDEGQRYLIAVRDRVRGLLRQAGAVRQQEAVRDVPGAVDTWGMLAVMDRLVELGDIKELKYADRVAGQFRIFVSAREVDW